MALALTAWPSENAFDAEIISAVADVAPVFVVPPELVKAVIKRESSFRAQAVSPAGALGLMQLMPYNASRVGLTREELWIPARNILGGTRLLAALLKHYHGDVISALVAYNARPRKLFAPIPQNGETPAYVNAVLRYWRQYRDAPLPVAVEPAGPRVFRFRAAPSSRPLENSSRLSPAEKGR